MDARTLNTEQLVEEYLEVCNASLERHRPSEVFPELGETWPERAEGRVFGVGVYRKDPAFPYDYYAVRLENGRLQLVEHARGDTDPDWKAGRGHLEDVVANQDQYVQDPAQLDLEWLKTRITGRK